MSSLFEEKLSVKTRDGAMPVQLFRPEGTGKWPAVIFYMDAGGVRPSMIGMSRRLASHGYVVALPDLYHRHGVIEPFEFKTVFQPGPERDRLFALFQSLNADKVMSDTGALLDVLAARGDVEGEKVGATGYCMGGHYALVAAGTFPERFAAVCAFHASRLANDAPDSPHRLAGKIRAKVYIAPAGIDQTFDDAEKKRLDEALKAGKVDYTIETYVGAKHGYAVDDSPVFEESFAGRHWQRLLEVLGEALRPR